MCRDQCRCVCVGVFVMCVRAYSIDPPPQAMSLACTTGQSVAREVPFKNAGNVPVRVRLKVTSDTDHFTVTPDFLLMEPMEVGIN